MPEWLLIGVYILAGCVGLAWTIFPPPTTIDLVLLALPPARPPLSAVQREASRQANLISQKES